MEHKNHMLRGIEHLSEQERLELFNVEELESRLEMAAIAGEAAQNTNCNGTCNQGCVPVDAGCW